MQLTVISGTDNIWSRKAGLQPDAEPATMAFLMTTWKNDRYFQDILGKWLCGPFVCQHIPWANLSQQSQLVHQSLKSVKTRRVKTWRKAISDVPCSSFSREIHSTSDTQTSYFVVVPSQHCPVVLLSYFDWADPLQFGHNWTTCSPAGWTNNEHEHDEQRISIKAEATSDTEMWDYHSPGRCMYSI